MGIIIIALYAYFLWKLIQTTKDDILAYNDFLYYNFGIAFWRTDINLHYISYILCRHPSILLTIFSFNKQNTGKLNHTDLSNAKDLFCEESNPEN